jgi:hypothetical protein
LLPPINELQQDPGYFKAEALAGFHHFDDSFKIYHRDFKFGQATKPMARLGLV